MSRSVDNLQSSIESWVTNIDSLSFYNLDRVLSYVSKLKLENINVENLFDVSSSENVSNLIVQRDITSGKIIDYYENFTNEDVEESTEEFNPEKLDENELLVSIPSLCDGIDFTKRQVLTDEKKVDSNAVVEINLSDTFKLNEIESESDEDDVLNRSFKEMDVKVDALTRGNEEFWLQKQQEQQKKDDNKCSSLEINKTKKWAVAADAKLVNEYEKIKQNLAYQWKFELDGFQKQAVYLMENSECVFVAAHTSAGKTVVAEYAIALAFKHKTKVIYTSPIKALSNQKFREFKTVFEDVGLITGDIQISQDASCLIMTTEILRSMLYKRSETLRDLEWVIFDEVHYMNDAHRGVVWEEVLILLPDHINIVMLSATIPNHMEFAEWVGKIKQRNIYVMCTKKRPVPLEHYLYTGNSTKTSNELFLLINSVEKYLPAAYTQAVDAKKSRSKGTAGSYGAKGAKQNATPAQEKNIWLSLIGMLEKKELLPCVSFIFSRKRCDDNINLLSSLDLNTESEKSEVHIFVRNSLSCLSKDDQVIPQILHLTESLKRGIGVHHSGILPLMKEIIELLFQRGLIKILFATETFAMGINMPARTVIFDSIRKHDGTQFRFLNTSEYIQMAGRAGRRGLDTTGTVIVLCKNEVPDAGDLQSIMQGKAAILESKFRITYAMILSLLRQKDMRIQDFMRSSFYEHKFCADDPAIYADAVKFLTNKLDEHRSSQVFCAFCSHELEKYYRLCTQYESTKQDLLSNLVKSTAMLKTITQGRVVFVKGFKKNDLNSTKLYPVMLLEQLKESTPALAISLEQFSQSDEDTHSYENLLKAIYSQKDAAYEKLIEKLKKFETVRVQLPQIQACLASFKHFRNATLISIKYKNLEAVSTKQVKITQNLNEIFEIWQKSNDEILSEELSKSTAFTSLALELYTYAESLAIPSNDNDDTNGYITDIIDYTKDLHIRDIDFTNIYDEIKKSQYSLAKLKCIKCPNFGNHCLKFSLQCEIQERLDYTNDVISGNRLLMVSGYRYRINVLKKLRLIDDKNFVLLKGKVALTISVLELFLTELIVENVFSTMQINEMVALLSAVVYQGKKNQDENPNMFSFGNAALDKGRDSMLEIANKINRIQRECSVQIADEDDFVEQLNFGLVEVVYEWSKGIPFAIIKELTAEQEGIIVRTIQRLDEICNNLKDASKLIGDTVLASKMEQCSVSIRRDIVFAGSLYTK